MLLWIEIKKKENEQGFYRSMPILKKVIGGHCYRLGKTIKAG